MPEAGGAPRGHSRGACGRRFFDRDRRVGPGRPERGRARRQERVEACSARAHRARQRHDLQVPETQARDGDARVPAAAERARLQGKRARGGDRHLDQGRRGREGQHPPQRRGGLDQGRARQFPDRPRRRRDVHRRACRALDRRPGQSAQAHHPRRGAAVRPVSARRSRRISRRGDHRHRHRRRRHRERAGARRQQQRHDHQPRRRLSLREARQRRPDPGHDQSRQHHRLRQFRAEGGRAGCTRDRHGRGRGARQVRPHHRPHRRAAAAQVRRILRHQVSERQPDRLSARFRHVRIRKSRASTSSARSRDIR